jgi:extracellular elastinolytic metalloproteinase
MVVTADNLSQDYTVPGTIADATATDNCEAVLSNSINSNASLTGSIFHEGQYTIIWTATDGDGNETTCTFTLTVNEFVSVNDISQSNISIYPNPANDFIMIEANGRVEISDISGKKLMSQELNSGDEIDLSSLKQGFYFVTVIEKERTQTTKLIKK